MKGGTAHNLPPHTPCKRHCSRTNFHNKRKICKRNICLYSCLRLINGIIKFDQKLDVLSPAFTAHQFSPGPKCWNIIIISSFAYYVMFDIYLLYLWPPITVDVTTVLIYLFSVPYIIDFSVIITVCFYLSHIVCRFRTMNGYWECLQDELVNISSTWTHSELVMLMESIRLLHAELCDLLKIFNLSYGPLLLAFFVCSYIDMIYIFYLMLDHTFSTKYRYSENALKYIPLNIYKIQNIVFMMSIIVAASWIDKQVCTINM